MRLAFRRALPWAITAAGLSAFILTRVFHPIRGLGNPDIAGILYSADLLCDGGLPYRDTSDLKSPGTFYLVAAIFGLFGRDPAPLSIGYAVWMALGAPALFFCGREIYGERGVIAGAVASALYLAFVGMFDMNYASWMTPAYAWSFSLSLIGLRRGSLLAHAGAGVAASWAVLLKPHAGVVVVAVAAVWWWSRRRGWPRAGASMLAAWTAGAAVGLLPLALHYGAHGALLELASGVFPIEAAANYTRVMDSGATLPDALWKVPRQHLRGFFLPLCLVSAAALGAWSRRARAESLPPFAPGMFLLAASVIGCGLGGLRFFVHYLPQCLPAWALLGAHPAAWDWLGARAQPRPWAVRAASWAHLLLTAGLAGYIGARIPFGAHAYFDNGGSSAVERVGQLIRERTAEGDPILVWGWRGWGVYYFADRRSPSRVFKVMGEVTDFNDNSAFANASEMHFREGPLADRLLADVRANPPRFFVRSRPFFPGLKADPLDEWPEMRAIVARDYQVTLRTEFLVVYERKPPSKKGR